jgi:hypothetical protein
MQTQMSAAEKFQLDWSLALRRRFGNMLPTSSGGLTLTLLAYSLTRQLLRNVNVLVSDLHAVIPENSDLPLESIS